MAARGGRREDARAYVPMLEKLRAMLGPVDNLREMTRRQVQRQEQRLRERAEQISRSVKEARADSIGLPWMSRETGTDMSYEYERWRRWAALAHEMKDADAAVVVDLDPARVEHWATALAPESLRAPAPLKAFREVKPLVREAEPPRRRRFRPPQ